MVKKEQAPIQINEGSDVCGLEGVGERPVDCPNNPWRYPENHRPAICQKCPGDQEIWKVAKEPLPLVHIRTKQGGEIILPKPNNS
ncbi:MAG: hypothetical protein A3H50_02180 [Candidatus Levybacteria bacterium RIFCSPLOWO2_02_FULL_37_10]|nr:MAG: hypothetical protein A2860_04695 [Candidatus Levybacteria bacterium RIFCSPHIGHO2_01_FULL_37_33]OGH29219.1 MAG: hypothetical protein A3F30_03210 [Candidatus Levybacteria bacterium RIFCSPHIGHO2_12_FULL_37_12]OGH33107.1 MAG: hypothetical protein A2953_03510 [Candidatus Levybacteria bacterium RIFCSPLOWO2_01_FULL_36_54]OGH33108.1 MAG: hypothetical protein A2953_03515 [Candidatus Levybacteria bacterium RIFCSPLOWO2_01_FULL_36_54]OGH45751.1 MAG: hypothetical protein A3H50_02180 [Candidatus Levy